MKFSGVYFSLMEQGNYKKANLQIYNSVIMTSNAIKTIYPS